MQVWGDKTFISGSYQSILDAVRKNHSAKNFDVSFGLKVFAIYDSYMTHLI